MLEAGHGAPLYMEQVEGRVEGGGGTGAKNRVWVGGGALGRRRAVKTFLLGCSLGGGKISQRI